MRSKRFVCRGSTNFTAWALRRIFKYDYGRQSLTAASYPLQVAFEWRAWRQLRRRILSRDFDVVLRILPIVPVLPSPFAFFLRNSARSRSSLGLSTVACPGRRVSRSWISNDRRPDTGSRISGACTGTCRLPDRHMQRRPRSSPVPHTRSRSSLLIEKSCSSFREKSASILPSSTDESASWCLAWREAAIDICRPPHSA